MAWTELIAIIAALASIAVAVAIFASIRNNTKLAKQSRDQLERHAKQTEEHAEQTHKIASAEIALRLADYWDESKYPHFANMVKAVAQNKVEKDDPRLGSYLSIWEEIAICHHDGVLTWTHAFEFFSADLQAMRNNSAVYEYLKAKNRKKTYLNLGGMLHDLTIEPNS